MCLAIGRQGTSHAVSGWLGSSSGDVSLTWIGLVRSRRNMRTRGSTWSILLKITECKSCNELLVSGMCIVRAVIGIQDTLSRGSVAVRSKWLSLDFCIVWRKLVWNWAEDRVQRICLPVMTFFKGFERRIFM